jgi:hypothetical protein
MKFFRSFTALALVYTIFTSDISSAQVVRRQSNGKPVGLCVIIIGMGVNLIGFASQNFKLYALGWSLIASGSVTSGSHALYDLVAENTELDLYQGKNLQGKVEVGPVLERIEMDSLVVESHPELAAGLPMTEVLNQLNLSSLRVAQIVLAARDLGDRLLGGKEVGSNIFLVRTEELHQQFGQLSDPELKIVTGYLRLRNISL